MNKSLQNLRGLFLMSNDEPAVIELFISEFSVQWINNKKKVKLSKKSTNCKKHVIHGDGLVSLRLQFSYHQDYSNNDCDKSKVTENPERLSHDMVSLK